MEKAQSNILSLIKEATGTSDVLSIDYKSVDKANKSKFDIKKVRGSVRLMLGRIKTTHDVNAMKDAFLALRIP